MKKILATLLCSAMLVSMLAACTSDKKGTENNASENTSATVSETATGNGTASEGSVVSDNTAVVTPTVDEAFAREIMDKNIECNLHIFDLDVLSHEETPVKDNIYKVTDERFKTLSDLRTFLEGVYVDSVVEELMSRGYDGETLYTEIDGQLCVNMDLLGGKGYYVDWTDYTISDITANSDGTYTFKVCASITEPGEDPTPQPYEQTAILNLVDGAWRLSELVY